MGGPDQILHAAAMDHVRAAGELGVQNVLVREERSVIDERNQIALGVLESARVEEVLHYESVQ